MKATPLADNILAEPIVEERSRGGIIFPESYTSEFDSSAKLYLVIAVGSGRLTRKGVRVPIECAPGDRVLCHSYEDGPRPLPNGQKIIPANQIILVLPAEQPKQEKGPLCEASGTKNESPDS